MRDIEVPRWLARLDRYRPSATSDDPQTPTFRYNPETAADITYSKTALWLVTLERHLGWETLRAILSTFFERYTFAHPLPEDFFAVAEEVSGRDLDWFFDQVHRGSAEFDYAVTDVSSQPAAAQGFVDGEDGPVWRERPRDEDTADTYRTEVVVQRLGGGVFPVDVLLVFDDGHRIRENWSGEERFRLFVVEHDARLAHAVVDPERVLMLDVNYTNNSRLREPAAALPARKWGSKWLIWLQDFLATFGFFA